MRWRALAVVVMSSGTLAATARSTPTSRLAYVRHVGADGCPDEAALRRAVAARLGYDPFFPWAKRTVVCEIEPDERGFRARLSITGEDGVALGERKLEPVARCEEQVQRLALAISIALDELDDARTPEAPAASSPAPEPEIAAPARSEPTPTPTPSPREQAPGEPARAPRLVPFVGASGVASFGSAPNAAVGAVVFGGVRYRAVSLALEGRRDLPSSTGTAVGGSIAVSYWQGALVPCAWIGPFFGCALAKLGSFEVHSSGIRAPADDATLFAAVGGRVGVEWPTEALVALRLHGEIEDVLTDRVATINGRRVFDGPRVDAALGLAARVSFR